MTCARSRSLARKGRLPKHRISGRDLLALRKNLPMLIAWASPTIPQSWPRVLTSGEKVPYGVAIAIGGIMIAVGSRYGMFAV